ncbi:MAG: protein kinase domain-containing protein [Parachlamydiaceae bacterium]
MAEDNFFNRPTLPPFFPKEAGQEPPLPTKIGPYTIEALLDRGGMSLLYLASDPQTQQPIAIKVLSPKFMSHPEMMEQFLKEAEIIALADHPNIVKLYGYGRWEQGLYIAMEFVQGISVRQYLMQNPLSLKKAIEMILEIAYAICHLHMHAIIHRDVKPENILIDETGHVKVIDFGIAQLIDPEHGDQGKEFSRLAGTPVYMSPEQHANPANVSYPSDIYSLGIIAYELALGKISQGQIHLKLMPKGLQKVLTKALQPNPEERYQDIVDFITDLSSYYHSEQFINERKSSDQSGELFEKFQSAQENLIPTAPFGFDGLEEGFVVHKPLGVTAIYAEFLREESLFIMAEPSVQETEGLMELLYLKGLFDGMDKKQKSVEDIARHLNKQLFTRRNFHPISLLLVRWNAANATLEFVSCGYGGLQHQSNEIRTYKTENPALGVDEEINIQSVAVEIKTGERVVIFPLLGSKYSLTEEQSRELLFENKALSPPKLAELIYRKTKVVNMHYFDEHPFAILTLEKKAEL